MMRAAASTLARIADRGASEPTGATGVLMARLDAIAAEQVQHGVLLEALTAAVQDLSLEVRGSVAVQARRRAASTRDGPDALLVLLLKQLYGDATFQVYEVMALSAASQELRLALECAGAQTGRKLGNLCERVEGRDMGGAHIIRLGENSKGVIWRVWW